MTKISELRKRASLLSQATERHQAALEYEPLGLHVLALIDIAEAARDVVNDYAGFAPLAEASNTGPFVIDDLRQKLDRYDFSPPR